MDRIDETAPALPDDITPSDNAFLVGNAAMLYEQKAQDTLIRAVAQLNRRTDRPVELVSVPPVQKCQQLRLPRHLLFALFCGSGRAPGRLRYGEAVDAFAMPSRWEGFCSAVAEALAAETARCYRILRRSENCTTAPRCIMRSTTSTASPAVWRCCCRTNHVGRRWHRQDGT
ncbi:hypothetical protein C9J85_02190 [Haloferax sp. wsp5]|nr:hypothetical protein C9J85_02190 [Haloferax sp. wsp5]